jgi:deaminated glutathione amidase
VLATGDGPLAPLAATLENMRVALCQIPVSSRPDVNYDRVAAALAEAADQGADLAVFPEATQIRFGEDLRAAAEPLDGPFCTGLAAVAKDTGVALVAGVFEPAPDGRVYNTAVAYDGAGELVASYRKLHLFDAFGHRESDQVAPGSAPVICTLAGLRTGLEICYDVRFGELSRALAVAGASLLVLPAAWAAGLFKEEHWVTLVRARAIENTVWVAAVGQVPDPGEPPTRAATGIGRSMLVDPLGVVRIDLGPAPGVAVAEVDEGLIGTVRASVPSLANRREDVFGAPIAVPG